MNTSFSLNKLFIILLFYISPIVDSFSGYLVLSGTISEGGVGSPSQLFRLVILVIALMITLNNHKKLYLVLLFIIYIVLIESVFFFIHNSLYGYIVGLVYGNKLVYLILIFTSLSILIKKNALSSFTLLKHIRNYVFITAIILIFSFISGLGFNTYIEGTFGFKGFFAAGNGLGIFMGTGLLLSIYYWKLTQKTYSLIFSIIIIFSVIIIGSKTALVLSLIGLVSMLFSFKNNYIKSVIILTIISIVTLYFNLLFELFQTMFDVILFRFNNSDSLLSWIMSNRDNYFIDAIKTISFDGVLVLRFLIGFGVFISFRNPNGSYNTIDTLESDFTDLFFMYGVIFILLYLVFIIFNLYTAFSKKKFFLSFIFLLIMLHSMLAGHILFNGMSGIMVPLISLLILTIRK